MRILDIGTGTGVLALMMAQACPAATVTAIDIDADAARQAAHNVASCSWAAPRVLVLHCSLQVSWLYQRCALCFQPCLRTLVGGKVGEGRRGVCEVCEV